MLNVEWRRILLFTLFYSLIGMGGKPVSETLLVHAHVQVARKLVVLGDGACGKVGKTSVQQGLI